MRCPCGWRIWNFKPLHRFEPHCNSVLTTVFSDIPSSLLHGIRHTLTGGTVGIILISTRNRSYSAPAWCRQSPAWYENSPQQTKTCLSKLRSTTFSSIRLSIMDAACLNHRWNTTVPDITPSTGPLWNPSWPIRKPR